MSCFSISRAAFIELMNNMENDEALLNKPCFLEHASTGRQPVPLEKQVLLSIWYLASGTETLVSIGQRFGLCEATAYRIRKRVLSYLANDLLRKLVKFPNSFDELMRGFRNLKGLLYVIAAIDGTHVPVRPPKDFPEVYVNRKGTHSLQV
jgi:hypothetical protein